MIASPARYSLLCALVLGGLAWVAGQGASLGLLPALALVPLVAWPAWLALAHAAATRRAQARAVLRDGAAPWWAFLLGGALLRQVLAVPVALLAGAGAGWWLLAQGGASVLWIAATAGLLYPVARAVAGQTGALRPYARLRPVLLAAPPLAAAGMTALWLAALGWDAPRGGSLAAHVAAEPRYEGASALLAWAVDAMALLSGARAWTLAWAEGRLGPVVTLWRLGAVFGQFWLIAGAFAGLLLPAGEARRILRASDADRAPPVEAGRAALAGFLLALVSAALLALAIEGEAWAGGRRVPQAVAEAPRLGAPEAGPTRLVTVPAAAADSLPGRAPPRLPTSGALRASVEAERIGALTCPTGTVAAVEAIDLMVRDLLAARRDEVERAARAGFATARARVPAFLDGYYSLSAEYLRGLHLLAGTAGPFLREQLAEALALEPGFEGLDDAIAAYRAPLPAEALARRDRLLDDCGLLPSDDAVLQVTATRPETLLGGAPAAAQAFEARLAASGAGALGGAVAGVVAGKVIAKLAASEAFGLAAEAVARLALGKAAGGLGGAAAGATAGALAGSAVPGPGTLVGAAVGGVLGGLAFGVATDYALIRLEEAVSREAFEAEILAALDRAEAELLAALAPGLEAGGL